MWMSARHPARTTASGKGAKRPVEVVRCSNDDDDDNASMNAAGLEIIAIETNNRPDPAVRLHLGRTPPTAAQSAAGGPDGPTRRRFH